VLALGATSALTHPFPASCTAAAAAPAAAAAMAGGHYQFLLEMPISVAHIMQNTGRDEYLLIE
jgi:hypothetical protein